MSYHNSWSIDHFVCQREFITRIISPIVEIIDSWFDTSAYLRLWKWKCYTDIFNEPKAKQTQYFSTSHIFPGKSTKKSMSWLFVQSIPMKFIVIFRFVFYSTLLFFFSNLFIRYSKDFWYFFFFGINCCHCRLKWAKFSFALLAGRCPGTGLYENYATDIKKAWINSERKNNVNEYATR